jgi:AraC family transcriptional regulator
VNNPLIVDYNRSQDRLQILPQRPLLASDRSTWHHLKLETYQLQAHSVPEHSPKQTAIVINHRSVNVRRRLGDTFKNEYVRDGDIIVCPTSVPHCAQWEEPVHFTLLLLEPEFILQSASKFKHPERIEILPQFARPDPVVGQIGLALLSQLATQSVERMYVDTAATFLAAHLLTHYSVGKSHLQNGSHTLSGKDLGRVLEYIDGNLCQNLGLTELANLLGLSERYFCEVFKQSTGVTPYQYLIECRISKAAQLLISTKLEIAEIARRTGFPNPTNFCRTFRQQRSVTPKQYRQG